MSSGSPAAGSELIGIGEVADRVGVAPSALRFYEAEGLIRSERSEGGRRRFRREVVRRVAFIRVAQQLGLTLEEIKTALAELPESRTPNRRDWARLSAKWRSRLDERISLLTNLRDDLDDCIGCGCLSLATCRLYNPDDRAAALGPGPRFLLGDSPTDVPPPSPPGCTRV